MDLYFYYSASNFNKTLVQSNISKVIRKYSENVEERHHRRSEDIRIISLAGSSSDCQVIKEKMISIAPVKLCDYGRSQVKMMETVKGFLEDVLPLKS